MTVTSIESRCNGALIETETKGRLKAKLFDSAGNVVRQYAGARLPAAAARSELHAAARAYAARGLKVFPVHANGKRPATPHGFYDACVDVAQIDRWWNHNPNYNIGHCPADSGQAVIDVEVDGRDAWRKFQELHGQCPETRMAHTPRGGFHLYFDGSLPTLARPLGKTKPIDTRGRGGYVLLPPSMIDGKAYRFAKDAPIAPLPAAYVEAFKKADHAPRDADPTVKLDQPLAIGQARSRIASFIRTGKVAIEGSGGDSCTIEVANLILDLGLSIDTATDLLDAEWNPHCVPPWPSSSLREKVQNARFYRQNAIGCDAPRAAADEFKDALPALLEDLDGSTDHELILPIVDSKGRPIKTSARNVAAFLKWRRVAIAFNEFTGAVEINGTKLNDTVANALHSDAAENFFPINYADFCRLLPVVAQTNRYHPVRDYLQSLQWDGKPRVDNWLSTYAGAEDSYVHREFGRVTLLGAVWRVMQPGCKFDTMLVLEGAQGTFKSSLVRALGGEWFADGLGLGSDAKVTIEKTGGRWIVEIPELSGMSRRDTEAIKAQLSTQEDISRLAYGRFTSEVPRQFILIGTTNDGRYLRDLTGNRRFMPVAVGEIDLEGFRRDRDQIWAEAYARVAKGEHAYLPQAAAQEAIEAQERRLVEDPVSEKLQGLLGEHYGLVDKQEIWRALGCSIGEQTRLAGSVTAAMQKMGWVVSRRRHEGERVHCYERIEPGNLSETAWLFYSGSKFTRLPEKNN